MRRFTKALAGGVAAMVLALTVGPAWADDVVNGLDATVDASVETTTVAAGASTSVLLRVIARNGDGVQACNLIDSGSATFSVSSSNTNVATVSSSVRIDDCGDTNARTVTVTGVATGTARITVSETPLSQVGLGTFDTRPATFDVVVTSTCATVPTAAPVVSLLNQPASTDWFNVASATAAFTVAPATNAEYRVNGGAWTVYSGAVSFTTDGVRSVEARNVRPASAGCTFAAGPASSATTIRVDKTAPVLDLDVTPDANDAGWNKTVVTADFTCTETGSGLVGACPADAEYGNGTNLASATFTVTDVAGNTSNQVTRPAIKVDTVAPVLTVDLPDHNGFGWNDSIVGTEWVCTDANFPTPSGCPDDETLGEGSHPALTKTVTDLAGNSTTATRREVKVDATKPGIAVAVSPDANDNGWNNSDVAVDWTCGDGGGSPLATACPDDETLSTEGDHAAVTRTVTDEAGNVSVAASRRLVRIDTTDPTLTVALRAGENGPVISANSNGWFNQDVVYVDFTCADDRSGVDSGTCPADYTVSAEGTQPSTTRTVKDLAGNEADVTVPVIQLDNTAPEVAVHLSTDANGAGWHNVDVTAEYDCAETGSGLAGQCPADELFSTDAVYGAREVVVTDLAGNSSLPVERPVIRVDKTAPVLDLDVTPDANVAGWNKTVVTVDFTCTETGSGLVGACPADAQYGNGTNLASADFTVTDVAGNTSNEVNRREIKVDTVAPVLTVLAPAANSAGWNDSVVGADWTCTDDNLPTPSGCPDDETLGEGIHAARTETVTDLAGNSTTATRREVKVDATKPGIAVAVSPDANDNGWNNSDVVVDWTCDAGSGSPLATACPADGIFDAEGDHAAVTRTVTDEAGNVSEAASRRLVRIDKTDPTLTVALRAGENGPVIGANSNGWFNQDVYVDFTCADDRSGVDNITCPADYTVSAEGTQPSTTRTVKDLAGNDADVTVPVIQLDTTGPTSSVVGLTKTAYVVGEFPTLSCSTVDGGSDVARSSTLRIVGPTPHGAVGSYTATCEGGLDKAGNTATGESLGFTVGYASTAFTQPVAPTGPTAFKMGSTIPLKFALMNVHGVRIPDAEAQALAASCSVRFGFHTGAVSVNASQIATFDATAGTEGICFRYDPTADQFIYNFSTKLLQQNAATASASAVTVFALTGAGGNTLAFRQATVALK